MVLGERLLRGDERFRVKYWLDVEIKSAERLVREVWNVSAPGPVDGAEFKGMPCFRGSYLAVTLHPDSEAQQGWKLSNGVKSTLKEHFVPGP